VPEHVSARRVTETPPNSLREIMPPAMWSISSSVSGRASWRARIRGAVLGNFAVVDHE
jgi:hypothetical protein